MKNFIKFSLAVLSLFSIIGVQVLNTSIDSKAYQVIGDQYADYFTVFDKVERNPDGRLFFTFEGAVATLNSGVLANDYNLVGLIPLANSSTTRQCYFIYSFNEFYDNFQLFSNKGLYYTFTTKPSMLSILFESSTLTYNFYNQNGTLITSILADTLTLSGITNLYLTTDFIGTYADGYGDGFNNGRVSGIADGYDDGYYFGKIDGDEIGYTRGYDEGVTYGKTIPNDTGYNDGYETGLIDGESIGYTKGLSATNNESYQAGYNAGMREGFGVDFSKWIVPVIIIVLLGGGALAIARKKSEDN